MAPRSGWVHITRADTPFRKAETADLSRPEIEPTSRRGRSTTMHGTKPTGKDPSDHLVLWGAVLTDTHPSASLSPRPSFAARRTALSTRGPTSQKPLKPATWSPLLAVGKARTSCRPAWRPTRSPRRSRQAPQRIWRQSVHRALAPPHARRRPPQRRPRRGSCPTLVAYCGHQQRPLRRTRRSPPLRSPGRHCRTPDPQRTRRLPARHRRALPQRPRSRCTVASSAIQGPWLVPPNSAKSWRSTSTWWPLNCRTFRCPATSNPKWSFFATSPTKERTRHIRE